MTGTLEADTDVASDSDVQICSGRGYWCASQNISDYLAGLPDEPTQQEQCCHHPRVRRGHSPNWSKTTPRCSRFLKYLRFVDVLGLQNRCCQN